MNGKELAKVLGQYFESEEAKNNGVADIALKLLDEGPMGIAFIMTSYKYLNQMATINQMVSGKKAFDMYRQATATLNKESLLMSDIMGLMAVELNTKSMLIERLGKELDALIKGEDK